jgi:hypothetical protein
MSLPLHKRLYHSLLLPNGSEFMGTKKGGTVRTFKQSSKGLYYLETMQSEANGTDLINTVNDNQYKYSTQGYC